MRQRRWVSSIEWRIHLQSMSTQRHWRPLPARYVAILFLSFIWLNAFETRTGLRAPQTLSPWMSNRISVLHACIRRICLPRLVISARLYNNSILSSFFVWLPYKINLVYLVNWSSNPDFTCLHVCAMYCDYFLKPYCHKTSNKKTSNPIRGFVGCRVF